MPLPLICLFNHVPTDPSLPANLLHRQKERGTTVALLHSAFVQAGTRCLHTRYVAAARLSFSSCRIGNDVCACVCVIVCVSVCMHHPFVLKYVYHLPLPALQGDCTTIVAQVSRGQQLTFAMPSLNMLFAGFWPW